MKILAPIQCQWCFDCHMYEVAGEKEFLATRCAGCGEIMAATVKQGHDMYLDILNDAVKIHAMPSIVQ